MTGELNLSVMSPARGSEPSLVHVGVFGLPWILVVPTPRMPVPNCSGSDGIPASYPARSGSFSGTLAMTISAVLSAGMGAPAVPTSRVPERLISSVPTVSRVSISPANARLPSMQTTAATPLPSSVTLWPMSMTTTELGPGNMPPHVALFDQRPEPVLRIGFGTAQKSGMLCGSGPLWS